MLNSYWEVIDICKSYCGGHCRGYCGDYYKDYYGDCCRDSYRGCYRDFYYLTWLGGQEPYLLLYNSLGAVGVRGDISVLKLNGVKNL